LQHETRHTVNGRDPAPRAFVGRAGELAEFARAVDDARLGVPSVVLVGGEAGMGKSTLLTEAAERGRVRLLVGRCMQLGGEVVPLGALADLLRHVQRTSPDDLAATEGLATFAPWVDPKESVGSRPSAEGVFAPVIDLLGRLASDDASVVAFEDLHWADTTTWDLFELLARNVFDERLVLVGTYRSDEVARDPAMRRRIAELARLPSARRVELSGLGREEIAARVAMLTGGTAEPALVDSVFARGEGNPFFTEELVRAHRAGDDVPDVLSDLISHDLAALDPPARVVLGSAAAIGRIAPHDLLASVVDLDEADLERALRAAVDAQLLVVDHGAGGYRFRHALIAEVVYDELLPSQRRRIHRRIADALPTAAVDAMAADRAGQRAFHLDRAGDVDGAFTALLAAADAAETVAPGVALRQLERAFELWDASPAAVGESRCERLWQAAELASGAAGNDRAVTLAREAFEHGVPMRGAAWAHERLGRYLWASGDLASSVPEFAAAAARVTANGDEPGATATMAGLAQAELMEAQLAAAEQWCSRVFERALTPAADRAAWIMATRVRGVVRAEQGDVETGVSQCRAAVAEATSAATRALATVYLGLTLLEAGQYRDAASVALDGGRDARLAGLDRSFGAYFDAEATEALVRLGHVDAAEAIVANRYASASDGFHPGRRRLAAAHAVLAARRGDGVPIEHLRTIVSQVADRYHAPLLDAGAAEAHLALGNWARAAEVAQRGWEATIEARPSWAVRFALFITYAAVELALDDLAGRVPVDVATVAGELTHRIDTARAAIEIRAAEPAPIFAVQLAHAEALIATLTGATPDSWSRVAVGWESVGDRWMAADARLREAEASVAMGDAARAASALREAHTAALDLASEPLLARVDAVSRRARISVESVEVMTVDQRSADRLGLTPREAEVLSLVAAGRTNRQIGEALYVSEKTASVHVSNILRKLGVTTRVEAAAVAQRLGID
jgi:DNA-binding CsgD family transcriptional regulator